MNAALKQCNLTAHRIGVAHAKSTLRLVARSQLRLPRSQVAGSLPNHPTSSLGSAGNLRACCSLRPSTRARATLRDKYGILRRALLGGILLSAGAMPFSSQRFSSAAAADLTADKVLRCLDALSTYVDSLSCSIRRTCAVAVQRCMLKAMPVAGLREPSMA